MTNETELLPCPFCGCFAAHFDGIPDKSCQRNQIYCPQCGIGTGFFHDYKECIKTWNTRAQSPQPLPEGVPSVEESHGKI